MSKRLSMGEEVGTMQFRVQGEQIKNDEIRKKWKDEYKENKKEIKKKYVWEKKKIYEFIKIK
jgi:hypothetical protein